MNWSSSSREEKKRYFSSVYLLQGVNREKKLTNLGDTVNERRPGGGEGW